MAACKLWVLNEWLPDMDSNREQDFEVSQVVDFKKIVDVANNIKSRVSAQNRYKNILLRAGTRSKSVDPRGIDGRSVSPLIKSAHDLDELAPQQDERAPQYEGDAIE